MSKQSKITVKHYLENRVKPSYLLNNEDMDYPIYCRLTYKRKTINFRSFTGLLMTENDYNFYLENNYINKGKKTLSDITSNFTLNEELIYIDLIIKILQDNNSELDIFKKSFSDDLKEYFIDSKEIILKIAWKNYLDIDFSDKYFNSEPTIEEKRLLKLYLKTGKAPTEFTSILNNKNTLLENIKNLKTITNVDIKGYFNSEVILIWEILELIIKEFDNKPIIHVLAYLKVDDLIKLCKKEKITIDKEKIKKLYNDLTNNVLYNLNPFPF